MNTALFNIYWDPDIYDFQFTLINIWIVIAVIKMCFYSTISRKKVILAALLLLVTYIYNYFGICDYMYLVAPIVAAINIDFERIAKVYMATVCTLLTITLVCTITGLVPNIVIIEQGRVIEKMQSLGFTSHNAFSSYLLFASLAAIYIFRNNKHRKLINILSIVVLFIFWIITACNTATILGIGANIIVLCNYLNEEIANNLIINTIKNKISIVLIGMPIYGVLMTVAGTLYYNTYQRTQISGNVISRYYLICQTLETAGVKMPHQTIDSSLIDGTYTFNLLTGLNKINPLMGDILYGQLLFVGGLMLLVPYVMIHAFLLYKFYKDKEFELLVIFSCVAAIGALESVTLDISFSLCEMLLFAAWGQNKIYKNSDNKGDISS